MSVLLTLFKKALVVEDRHGVAKENARQHKTRKREAHCCSFRQGAHSRRSVAPLRFKQTQRMTEAEHSAAAAKEKEELPAIEDIIAAHRAEDEDKAQKNPRAWRFFRDVLGQPRFFLAPMVDCSVLPFRLLCKRHGTHVGVSPMIHAFAPFPSLSSSTSTSAQGTTPPHNARVQSDLCPRRDVPAKGVYLVRRGRPVDRAAGRPRRRRDGGGCKDARGRGRVRCCGREPRLPPARGTQGRVRRVPRRRPRAGGDHCQQAVPRVHSPGDRKDARRGEGQGGAEHRLCPDARALRLPDDHRARAHKRAGVHQRLARRLARHQEHRVCHKPRPAARHHTQAHNHKANTSSEAVSVPVVANGGIKCLDDAKRCLIETKAQAVMAGSLSTPFNPQASKQIPQEHAQHNCGDQQQRGSWQTQHCLKDEATTRATWRSSFSGCAVRTQSRPLSRAASSSRCCSHCLPPTKQPQRSATSSTITAPPLAQGTKVRRPAGRAGHNSQPRRPGATGHRNQEAGRRWRRWAARAGADPAPVVLRQQQRVACHRCQTRHTPARVQAVAPGAVLSSRAPQQEDSRRHRRLDHGCGGWLTRRVARSTANAQRGNSGSLVGLQAYCCLPRSPGRRAVQAREGNTPSPCLLQRRKEPRRGEALHKWSTTRRAHGHQRTAASSKAAPHFKGLTLWQGNKNCASMNTTASLLCSILFQCLPALFSTAFHKPAQQPSPAAPSTAHKSKI